MSYTSIIVNSGVTNTGGAIGISIPSILGEIEKDDNYILQFKVRPLNEIYTLDNIYIGSQKLNNINMRDFETITIEGVVFYNCYISFIANNNVNMPSAIIGRLKTTSDINNSDVFEITELALYKGTKIKEYEPNNNDIQIVKKQLVTMIEQVSDSITLKAERLEIDTLNNKIDKALGQIHVATGEITLKATNEEVNNLGTKVNEAMLKLEPDSILSVVEENSTKLATKSELNSLTTQVQTVNNTLASQQISLDGITQRVSSTESTLLTTSDKINNLEIGGRNLVLNSNVEATNNDYQFKSFQLTELYEVGQEYTISICVTPGQNVTYYQLYTNNGSKPLCPLYTNGTSKQIISNTFTFGGYANETAKNRIQIYRFPNNGTTSNSTIHWIKLEKGNKATDYSPAPEDMETTVSNLTSRVQTAESQLTEEGLTTIIGDHYTTTDDVNGIVTSKGYATTSQVQQTANSLTATFKSSGGYNLIKNGKAVIDTSFWKSNGGGISRGTNAGGAYIGTYFTTGLPNGITGTEWIELKNNTDYVYQAMLYSPDIDIPNNSDGPMHMQTNSTQASGHTQVTLLDYNNAVPRNKWTQCYLHFRTAASGRVYFMPFVYKYDVTAPMYASEIMLSESTVPLPYSPHPTEIYDGITKIDKNGITVTQSNAKSKTSMTADGFAITRTDNNKDIFRVASNGVLTLNGNFKCYRDGANQSGPRLESSGAIMYGYNNTGGSNPVFASGLWTDEDMGYFSVGYTRADVTDANGCLWLSPQNGNNGCRLTFSKLVSSEMKTTNLYFQKDGAIDFTTNMRGYNDTDDNYTYRFDSGVSVKAFRCNHIRTHNIYPRNNGSHNIGSPTMRYKDVFFDSASTTNSEFRIGTVNTDGSWKTYGPLCVNSSSGYVFPSGNANLSLGMSSYRFHTLFCTNNPNVSSDKRMKTDIHYLGMPYEPEVVNGRSRVNMNITTGDMRDFVKNDLKLASYRYKVNIGKGDTSVDYGFIAQDILYTKVGSEIVQLEDPNNFDSNLSFNQGNYITTIAGALQEEIKVRDEQITELEDKVIGRLQEEIKMKDSQISDLEDRLAKLESIIEQLIEK